MSVGISMDLHLHEQEHWPQSPAGDGFLETLASCVSVESDLGGICCLIGGSVSKRSQRFRLVEIAGLLMG